MSGHVLAEIQSIIQADVNGRGLRSDPETNLVSATAADFPAACRNVAGADHAAVGIVTGFFIPHGDPPAGETDGPLGALFLARVLTSLGIKVVLATDPFAESALAAGLEACHLEKVVDLVTLPTFPEAQAMGPEVYRRRFAHQAGRLTHLIALERVGPSHTPESIRAQPGATDERVEEFRRAVPADHHDRCHTMRCRDVTATMSPAHWLFEAAPDHERRMTTIGIGDGGNEIGMGLIPWNMIRRNIPDGEVVACRVPTDFLLVCGVSNWGAYGLAAGVAFLRAAAVDPGLFDPEQERQLLQIMIARGPLVDGVTGRPTVTVDGLSFERYVEPLPQLRTIITSRYTTGGNGR
jgi:hypothetical protein